MRRDYTNISLANLNCSRIHPVSGSTTEFYALLNIWFFLFVKDQLFLLPRYLLTQHWFLVCFSSKIHFMRLCQFFLQQHCDLWFFEALPLNWGDLMRSLVWFSSDINRLLWFFVDQIAATSYLSLLSNLHYFYMLLLCQYKRLCIWMHQP